MKKILTFSTRLLKRALITFSVLILIFFLAVSVQFYKSLNSKKNLYKSVTNKSWREITPAISEVIPLGSPGVTTIKNLYVQKNDYLLAHGPEQTEFNLSQILNDQGSYQYNLKITPLNTIESSKTAPQYSKMIPGTTLILSASNEMKAMQPHYFHFCEEFLLAWSAYRQTDAPPIQTIIFPDTENWKGRVNDISAQIIKSVIPDAQVISASEFNSLSKKYLLQFENAILVDRHACHHNDVVNQFNKMAMAHKDFIKKDYIEEIRDSVLKNLKTYKLPNNKPYVTYIMRKSYRYLEPEFEKKLLSQIQEQFQDYRLNPVWLEDYSFAQQMQMMRNTKVLIGAHGNGLTNQLFLPSNSLVIEIFPEGAYANDYQLFAELSGHTYFGIDPKSGVISKGEGQMPIRGDVNQVITEFAPTIVTNLIQDFASKERSEGAETLKETSFSE